jgi:hypothetical protein
LRFFNGVFVRFSTRGVQKHTKKLLEKIHVKSFWPKKLRPKKNLFLSSFPVDFLSRFLAVSLHEELKNTTKTFWRKSEKVKRKKLFSFRLFPSICFIAFLAVSLHNEPKNTIKIFSKIGPENLKKSQKR